MSWIIIVYGTRTGPGPSHTAVERLLMRERSGFVLSGCLDKFVTDFADDGQQGL